MLESFSRMDKKFNLILASASSRRKDLLALMDVPFETRPGNFLEPKKGKQSTRDYVLALAMAKADHVASYHGEILLAADTIVKINNELLGKPSNDDEAEQTLSILRGNPHRVYTGLVLRDVSSGEILQTVCETIVYMRDWTPEEQATYICRGTYRDKAGGYAIQDEVFNPVARIEGCYANVMGLPLCHLCCLFEQKALPLPKNLPKACQSYTKAKCSYYSTVLKNMNCQRETGRSL